MQRQRNQRKKNRRKSAKKKKDLEQELKEKIEKLTVKELRDLVLVNTYKLAMTRAQIEALLEILKEKKLLNYESFWKKTKKYIEESLF
ncbi:hypothetical protein J7K74_03695 [Candidatus Woesearchaeota archaeon]|nr:hypothetical protein [Candidatus Woesearchaeota archaeon]